MPPFRAARAIVLRRTSSIGACSNRPRGCAVSNRCVEPIASRGAVPARFRLHVHSAMSNGRQRRTVRSAAPTERAGPHESSFSLLECRYDSLAEEIRRDFLSRGRNTLTRPPLSSRPSPRPRGRPRVPIPANTNALSGKRLLRPVTPSRRAHRLREGGMNAYEPDSVDATAHLGLAAGLSSRLGLDCRTAFMTHNGAEKPRELSRQPAGSPPDDCAPSTPARAYAFSWGAGIVLSGKPGDRDPQHLERDQSPCHLHFASAPRK